MVTIGAVRSVTVLLHQQTLDIAIVSQRIPLSWKKDGTVTLVRVPVSLYDEGAVAWHEKIPDVVAIFDVFLQVITSTNRTVYYWKLVGKPFI
jgi:hypothetical protein